VAATAHARGPSLGAPITASLFLHAAIVAAVVVMRPAPPPPSPPLYRVNMVAAPPGPPAIGVVRPTPTPTTSTTPPPVRPKIEPRVAPLPTKKPPPRTAPKPQQATPTAPTETKPPPANTQAPTAGGGDVGGKGADVANVNTGGIEFPYPGYLERIVREIRLRFKPTGGGALRADVSFLIQRDGSVRNIRLVTRSGNFSFDLEAQGAVEAAANARAFGPLPSGFPDDVLPVIFSFDPSVIRR